MNNTSGESRNVALAELVDTEKVYSLQQLCDICQVSPSIVNDYIEYNVIDIDYGSEIVFRQIHLDRLRKGVRLQRDLELNHAGVALALELLDTIEQLKQEVGKLRVRTGW